MRAFTRQDALSMASASDDVRSVVYVSLKLATLTTIGWIEERAWNSVSYSSVGKPICEYTFSMDDGKWERKGHILQCGPGINTPSPGSQRLYSKASRQPAAPGAVAMCEVLTGIHGLK